MAMNLGRSFCKTFSAPTVKRVPVDMERIRTVAPLPVPDVSAKMPPPSDTRTLGSIFGYKDQGLPMYVIALFSGIAWGWFFPRL